MSEQWQLSEVAGLAEAVQEIPANDVIRLRLMALILYLKPELLPRYAAASELYEALFDLAHASNFVGKQLLDNFDPEVKARILAVLAEARGEA